MTISTLGAVVAVENGVSVEVVSVAGTDPIEPRVIDNQDFNPGLGGKGIGFAWLTDNGNVSLDGGEIEFTSAFSLTVTPPTTDDYEVRCLLIG